MQPSRGQGKEQAEAVAEARHGWQRDPRRTSHLSEQYQRPQFFLLRASSICAIFHAEEEWHHMLSAPNTVWNDSYGEIRKRETVLA
jgi:hypothetical protein